MCGLLCIDLKSKVVYPVWPPAMNLGQLHLGRVRQAALFSFIRASGTPSQALYKIKAHARTHTQSATTPLYASLGAPVLI